MRLGVLDVGSNTVHLVVVDARRGAHPDPVSSWKRELRLAELLDDNGALGPRGRALLVDAVGEARDVSDREGADDLVAFATSAVRDAVDAPRVLADVLEATGVELAVLPGGQEAALTFFAVRRWFGWSSGRLLSLDIGGGSLEIAVGRDERPDVALSVPLGAGRLTRRFGTEDRPTDVQLTALVDHVRSTLAAVGPVVAGAGAVDRAVATSKTFRSLARVSGAAPRGQGPRVARSLTTSDAFAIVERLATLSAAERAELPGVSPGRAGQLLAGAVVAAESMRALGVRSVDLCPWALREGVVLRRLDWLTDEDPGDGPR